MSETAKGNVLFITIDQWRGDCLSAAGHPVLRTPIFDQLAADGVLFTKHYTQASPCGPARASLYTGMYLQNHRSGRNGMPLDARHTNLALEARKAGYEPVLFGYTDTSPDPRGRDQRAPRVGRRPRPACSPDGRAITRVRPVAATPTRGGVAIVSSIETVEKSRENTEFGSARRRNLG